MTDVSVLSNLYHSVANDLKMTAISETVDFADKQQQKAFVCSKLKSIAAAMLLVDSLFFSFRSLIILYSIRSFTIKHYRYVHQFEKFHSCHNIYLCYLICLSAERN
ncbi:MAG TPA: hypothetical protein VK173_07590 [Lacibacter sp.]|nr:hypothetical protein [Lacibacter sp.]